MHTTDKVFALTSPEHLLKKLCWEISELKHALATSHHDPFVPAYHAWEAYGDVSGRYCGWYAGGTGPV